MSYTPPVGQPKQMSPDPLKPSAEKEKGQKEVEKTVEQATLGKLPSQLQKDIQQQPYKVDKAAIKPYQEAKIGMIASIKGGLFNYFITPAIKGYVEKNIGGFDEEAIIDGLKNEMSAQLGDPQFVEFYEFINKAILSENIKTKIGNDASDFAPPELTGRLLEVILARGMTNLALQVSQIDKAFPPPAKQPALVSMMSLLSNRIGKHIDQAKLQGIEGKYQKCQAYINRQIPVLFPEMTPKMEEDLQKYLKEYTRLSTTAARRTEIKNCLFPNLATASGLKAGEIAAFFAYLDMLPEKDGELKKIFSNVSNEIILCLFPKKLADIPELKGTVSGLFENKIFGLLQTYLSDFLQKEYELVENDLARNQKWENELVACLGKDHSGESVLGAADLKPLIDAPAALLVGLTKKYIQSNPSAIEMTSRALHGYIHPQDLLPGIEDPSIEHAKKLNLLSQEQLAAWIVESLQVMLNTKDPQLAGLGNFVTQIMNNLSLALMAKGSKLVMPENEKIAPNAFLKEFINGLIAKAGLLKSNQAIPEQFWKDFVKDLPLPSPAKDLLLSELIKRGEGLKKEFNDKVDLQQILKIGEESTKTIEGYQGGEQLLSITKKISDQMVETIFGLAGGPKMGNETFFGLDPSKMGDAIKDLIAEYLPGWAISDKLKDWFKNNVSALGAAQQGQAPQSIDFIKKGVQAVLQQAMINTINKNFHGDGKSYAEQLLINLHEAFSTAFAGFNASQRKKVTDALEIQKKIDQNNAQMAKIKKSLAEEPKGISDKETSLVKEVVASNARYTKAVNEVNDLIEKRKEMLATLNKYGSGAIWTFHDLPLVDKALTLRKDAGYNFTVGALKNQIKNYEHQSSLTPKKLQELNERRVLLALLEMTPNDIDLLSEIVRLHLAIGQANKRLGALKKDLSDKNAAVVAYDLKEKPSNEEQWENAKTWVKTLILGSDEINQLSQAIPALEKELDANLEAFQVLSEKLTDLLGLGDKEKLILPPYLKDKVWPYIQAGKKKQIARFLFNHISPLFVSQNDLQQNRDKLNQLSKGDPFFTQAIRTASEELIDRFPEYVTSYKPFATEILSIMRIDLTNKDTAQKEVARMEEALNKTLINSGKKKVSNSLLTPLVNGIVPPAYEEAFSKSLAAFIEKNQNKEISTADILAFLKSEIKPSTPKEEQQIDKQAPIFAKSLNQFFLNRGKENLEAEDLKDLLESYQNQVQAGQVKLPIDIEGVKQALISGGFVEKIKKVVFTPEEMAQVLNDFIPGATDLHTLIAPQLQNVITGKDPAFKANREMLRQIIEGTLLRLFIRVAETNQTDHQGPLTAITEKLKNLAAVTAPKENQSVDAAAHEMIDKVLGDILTISKKEDLESIPKALQAFAFEKIRKQAHLQATPLIRPMIERNQNLAKLQIKSGSNFLGDLCKTISKDIFTLLPDMIKSHRAIAKDIFTILSEAPQSASVQLDQLTFVQLDQLTSEISTLAQEKNVTNEALVKAYGKAIRKTFNEHDASGLAEKLKEKGVVDAIKGIAITPEKIASEIGKNDPHIDDQFQKTIAKELQGFLNNPTLYQNGTEFFSAYLEGILLKVFMKVAEKNPKDGSKDTLVVLTEKFLKTAAKKYHAAVEGQVQADGSKKQPQDFLKEFKKEIMKELLGIDSPLAFEGLPEPLQTMAYKGIKKQLGDLLLSTSPLFASMVDLEKNTLKLNEISNGNPFLGNIIHAASKEAISLIPEWTSYKPFAAQVLTMMGISPTEEVVESMEEALHNTLIELGKEGVDASQLKPLVKGYVPESKESAFSQSLLSLIKNESKEPVASEDILDLLKKEVKTKNQNEVEQLEKRAQLLTNEVNQLLLNRGKPLLTAEQLLEAYENQVLGDKIPSRDKKGVLEGLQPVVEKIKGVMTPQEISQTLSHFIPTKTGAHFLLAPQLQAAAEAANSAVQADPAMLQQLIEGTITRFLLKIAETNPGDKRQSVLAVITEKLKNLAATSVFIPKAGQTAEETARDVEQTAHNMIDQVLKEVIGISAEKDLDGIPVFLRERVYDILHKQAYQQLTPLIKPMIERNLSRAELEKQSGSKFLGDLCEGLSTDFFALLPTFVKSHEALAEEIFTLLAGKKPDADQLEQFTPEITALLLNNTVKNHRILSAYEKVIGHTLTPDETVELTAKLKEKEIENTAIDIYFTPEEITSIVGELAPHLDARLKKDMAKELQEFLNNPNIYPNGSEFVRAYVEGAMLKLFIGAANKNPKDGNKDTLIVITEKLLDAIVQKFKEAKAGKPPEEIAKEIKDTLMKDLLGMDSPLVLKGIPTALQAKAYDFLEKQVSRMLLEAQNSFATLSSSDAQIQQTKEKTKEFGFASWTNKGLVNVLADDIANLAINAMPHVLSEDREGSMAGVTIITKNIESYLEGLARGNIKIAKTLLEYKNGDQFKQKLKDHLGTLTDQDQFIDDKKKAAELLGNMFVKPLNNVIEKAVQFENTHKKQFNQKLMAGLLRVGANHLKHLNAAKDIAAQDKRAEISHADFVKAAGKDLHAGVPKADVNYEKTIQSIADRIYGKLPAAEREATGQTYAKLSPEQEKIWIKEQDEVRKLIKRFVKSEYRNEKIIQIEDFIAKFNSIHARVTGNPLTEDQRMALADPKGLTLRQMMRQEFSALYEQRQDAAYAPAVENIMKMMFPNGQHDLTFIPEELRGTVWRLFDRHLFSQILPLITETLFDPATINSMVLKGLKVYQENLKGDIVLEAPEPEDPNLDDLDEAAGELIEASMKTMTLPGWAKNMVVDRKSGKTTREWKKTLGAVMRKQFNDTFIQDKLKLALESAVARDEKGEYVLNFDARPKGIKKAQAVKDAVKMQADLKKAFRDTVDVSIGYYFRTKGAEAQAGFDKIVYKIFGERGVRSKVRSYLDKMFNFIFFTIIGTALSILFWPVKEWIIKPIIYKVISLDKNRETIMELLTKAPVDQPETDGYAILHENLVFHAGEAISRVVKEFVEKEPLIPMKSNEEDLRFA